MNNKGFTLIELIVVVVLLGVLAVIAAPKFINLQDDAKASVMISMEGALKSAEKLIALKIQLNPERLNGNQNRFRLDDGQNIRVRGKLADGRWDNTFVYLLDFSDIEQVTSNDCTDETLKWCVRQRGTNWFINRGYSILGTGRGFVIYPYGKNVNQDSCYIYYMNQNDSAIPDVAQPSIIGRELSEC
jgi:MSHA pilin protein MshA